MATKFLNGSVVSARRRIGALCDITKCGFPELNSEKAEVKNVLCDDQLRDEYN